MKQSSEVLSEKQRRAQFKLARIPVKIEPTTQPLRKPEWWPKIQLSTTANVMRLKHQLRKKRLHTVCEEASCPNLAECFSHGTATFMIMGDKCLRRCGFCDVTYGKPDPLDPEEPKHVAESVKAMGLKYVVLTSVVRDDLPDGGASHFSACIAALRDVNPQIKVEILVPDFRKRETLALDILCEQPCDVFNHNIETIPRLYQQARLGSDYHGSLRLLAEHKKRLPHLPTKSGLMLGLGETNDEIKQVLRDLREHNVEMLTLGQYLQPTKFHLPVKRYVEPSVFDELGEWAKQIGFTQVASGPLVRSSYHADKQAAGETVS